MVPVCGAALAEVTRMRSLPKDLPAEDSPLRNSFSKDSFMDRRKFLAASGGLLAATVPGGSIMVHAAESVTSSAPAPNPWPAGSVRKIPIGVFDPVYEHLSLDAMLDKVTALVEQDRKSTRLNSSHVEISYAVFCLKKKNQQQKVQIDNRGGDNMVLFVRPNSPDADRISALVA